MTHASPIAKDSSTAALAGRRVEVRWSAVRVTLDGAAAVERVAFVIALEPVDDGHALLEAWLETAAGAHVTAAREPVHCHAVRDGSLLHLDAFRDGERLLAVSLDPAVPSGTAGSILYARSPLLTPAGLVPGGYDPPTARVVSAGRDAASA
jgi:hypothetical protein